MQVQVKPPTVLAHVALAWHPAVPAAHSSTSVQLNPVPEYPALHAQLKLPGEFVHVALAWHPAVPAVHSSTSVQMPSTRSNPALHGHW